MFHAIMATLYGNCDSLATKIPDVSLLVKHMIKEYFLQKQLGLTGLHNNCIEYALRDLFVEEVIYLLTDIKLCRYV